jgi:hypothetical protein
MMVDMATATYNRRSSSSTGSIRTELLVGTGSPKFKADEKIALMRGCR